MEIVCNICYIFKFTLYTYLHCDKCEATQRPINGKTVYRTRGHSVRSSIRHRISDLSSTKY